MKYFLEEVIVAETSTIVFYVILYGFSLYLFIGGILSFTVPARKRKRPVSTARLAQQWRENKVKTPDRVKIIADPTDALAVRIAMLQSAEKQVDLTSFAFTNFDCGTAFLSEVLHTADRGVKVRIIVDAKMGKLYLRTMRQMVQHPLVEISRYNPLNIFLPWTVMEDMHDKFMVVDGKYAILGGRNIEPYYFGLAEPPLADKYDWDVFMVKDPGDYEAISVIDVISDYFELLWNNRLNKRVRGKICISDKRQQFHEIAESFKKDYPEFYDKSLDYFCQDMIRPARIRLLHNPLRSGRKEPWIVEDLLEIADETKDSLYIQTPYATATKPILKLLEDAASRFHVVYITNSYRSAKNPPAYPNYYYQRQKFLNTGINIYEYQDRDSIHGKSMVFDERVSLIGSFNLDSRSVYLDTETMLAIDSPEFTQTLLQEAKRISKNSLQVSFDNEYLPSDIVEEAEVPCIKKIIYFSCFVGLRPFQFYL